MSISFPRKERYTMDDLKTVITLLRSPEGCPWDREQTHQSIRNNFIEEVYEAADAIDRGDVANLREELGDVLLQVMLHSEMERELNNFDFDDIVHELCDKLVIRHPHVFGAVVAENESEALDSWEAAKRRSKNQTTFTETLQSVPMSFPGLMRAQKVQKRAAKAGFDWPDVSGAIQKLHEETDEVLAAQNEGIERVTEELGDLLFSVVNVARFLKVDSEQAVQYATDKFIRRFSQVEKLADQKGMDMKSASLEELDSIWDEVKEKEILGL